MRNNGILIIAAILVFTLIQCNSPQNRKVENTVDAYLDSLEILFADVPRWLTTVYDSASGGFYHNALMAQDTFTPDLQSTSFALNILLDGNILSTQDYPQKFKDKLKEYILERYDPDTDLILDPQYAERVLKSDRALGRSQNMAANIIKMIEIKNEFPAPLNSNNTPEYLHSLKNFEQWLYNRKWSRVWSAFDHIGSQSTFINKLPKERKDSVILFVEEYARSIQDEDGLWGKGQAQEVRISGAVKYAGFCKKMDIPIPNPDKIYQTVLKWLKNNTEMDFTEHSVCPICVPRNVYFLLYFLKPQLSFEIPKEDYAVLVKSAYLMLDYYHSKDGGFLKNHKETTISPLDIKLGYYDESISDMNGTHLAIDVRKGLYDILDMELPSIPSDFFLKYIK